MDGLRLPTRLGPFMDLTTSYAEVTSIVVVIRTAAAWLGGHFLVVDHLDRAPTMDLSGRVQPIHA
jgi:hypothetical protein